MAQPPAYNREKNFTLNSGRETDHAALNAELDKASNSINDIRTNLAILQADDGKLRPSVVTPDSISEELRVSLVEGVVMDAQAMLDESRKASETSKSSAEKAKESETKAAASEKAATASWEQVQEYARSAQTSAQEARCVYGKIEKRADDIVEEAAREAEKQAQASAGSAASADRSAEEAALHAAIAGQRGIPVGTVVMFTAAEPPAGYLKCDGAAVGRETCPELFAAIGTTFGAGDGKTTFNLPNLIGRFAEGSATPGTVKEAGLPNLVGYSDTVGFSDTRFEPTGCFYPAEEWNAGTFNIVEKTGTAGANVVRFDASHGNPTYGKSDTVQPPALTLLPCIKAFDAAVDSGLIDITELANEVTGKADTNLSNLSATGKTKVASLAMPSGNCVDLSLNTNPSQFVAIADGYFYAVAYAEASSSGYINFSNASAPVGAMLSIASSSAAKILLPVRKGDVVDVNWGNLSKIETFRFVYAQGSLP